MEMHYNAFISYRHHPDDIRVATEIHRALERFKVPKALRKESKGITRLFRDKDELPITSNLTDDIAMALKNSEYLIVICSVHTKESIWVQREIELFLKTHHRSRVLTVLASGEPYEVIPEILLHEDAVDPVTGEVTRLPVEPLSCDWRMGRRKAYREELPRLAAALLHCGYDELRQRQRQYRMRQLIVGFSVALAASLALMTYFIYTSITIRNANIRIQENLEEALRNQSRHLATAAQERLEAGDRLTAITLAAAALPSENNERPYVPEAEAVLCEALGVYEAEPEVGTLGVVDPGAVVTEFWASEDSEYLYLQDSRHIITVWESATQRKLGSVDYGDSDIGRLLITDEGNFIFRTDSADRDVFCYRPDGTLLWQKSGNMDIAFMAGKSILLVLGTDEVEQCRLQFLDPATGEEIREPLPLEVQGGGKTPAAFCEDSYPANMPITVKYSGYLEADDGAQGVCLVSPDTGEQRFLMKSENSISRVTSTESGNILVMTDPIEALVGRMFGERYTGEYTQDIFCYSAINGQLLWQSEITTYLYAEQPHIAQIPGSSRILCQAGNTFQVLDGDTGEVLSRCESTSGVVALDVRETYTAAILQDGYVGTYVYSTNGCEEIKWMEADLTDAEIGGYYFGKKVNDSQVTIYAMMEREPDWSVACADAEYGLVQGMTAAKDNLVAVSDYTDLYLLDMQGQKLQLHIQAASKYHLGFSEDGSKFWIRDGYIGLYGYDTRTGAEEKLELPSWLEGEIVYLKSTSFLHRDSVYYLAMNAGNLFLASLDLNTQQTTSLRLPFGADSGELDLMNEYQIMTVTEEFAWFRSSTGSVYEVNRATGEAREILSGTMYMPFFAFHESGELLALGYEGEIQLRIPGGETVGTISLTGWKAGALCFYGDELLALSDAGDLYRLDQSGNQLSYTELVIYDTYYYDLYNQQRHETDITWQFTQDGRLILNVFDMANIIECDTWVLCAYVPDCVWFDEAADEFLCCLDSGFVALPRLTVAELLETAQIQLGTFALSQEEKKAYGIG